jgi:hypothetical protein
MAPIGTCDDYYQCMRELEAGVDDKQAGLALSFARILHVYQDKRIAPITVRLIPRLLSGELKKKAGQTATSTTPRVTAIVCANCAQSEAAQTSGNRESRGAFVTMMKATHSRPG